jgi:hypothetical protein
MAAPLRRGVSFHRIPYLLDREYWQQRLFAQKQRLDFVNLKNAGNDVFCYRRFHYCIKTGMPVAVTNLEGSV